MIIVGLTGSIASGKSYIGNLLRTKGYMVIDADKIAKSHLNHEKVISNFPAALENNQISPYKLAKIVFKDMKKLQFLESIIHPLTATSIKTIINKSRSRNIIFIEAPLLIESGFDKYCNFIICVTVNKPTRVKRLEKRNSLDKNQIKFILSRQIPDQKKLLKSNFIIYGSMGKFFAIKQIDYILEHINSYGNNRDST